jgi:hypothetical protein
MSLKSDVRRAVRAALYFREVAELPTLPIRSIGERKFPTRLMVEFADCWLGVALPTNRPGVVISIQKKSESEMQADRWIDDCASGMKLMLH